MVLPPKHVYSAIVKNNSAHEVEVTATYSNPDETTSAVTVKVAAGAEATFPEKTMAIATAVHVANISAVSVAGGAEVSAPFNIASPVKDYLFTIDADLKISH